MSYGKQLVSLGYGMLIDGFILLEHLFKVYELSFGPWKLVIDLGYGAGVRLAWGLLTS